MLTQILLFLFGTAIGSFLNVLAMRYEDGGRIFRRDILTGRSHCSHCGETLRWYELIPLVSFVLQLGRCRHCGRGLSWQYPIVEILSGLIFVLVPMIFFAPFIWVLIFLTLLLITLIDLRLSIIPDQLNVFLALLAAGLLLRDFSLWHVSDHLIGAVVGCLVIGLLVMLTRGKGMGVGDWKMVTALGFLFGWPEILILLAFAFIIGGFSGSVLMLFGNKKIKDSVPFGPFLALASLFTIIFGGAIIRLYL